MSAEMLDALGSPRGLTRAAADHVETIGAGWPRPNGAPRVPVLRVTLDTLALVAAVALAFPLRFTWHVLESTPGPIPLEQHVVAAALWVVGVLGAMSARRLYDEDTLSAGGREFGRVRQAIVAGIALVAVATFLLQLVTVSRGWLIHVVTLSTIFLCAERALVRAAIDRDRTRGRLKRAAILVTSERPDGLVALEREFDVVGVVAPSEIAEVLADRRAAVDNCRPPVVIIDGPVDRDELWTMVLQAGDAGCPVFLSSPFRALPADRLTTRTLGERTIMKVSPPALTGVRALQKRLLDIVGAAVLLAGALIPMAAIAGLILVTSGRPVLFRQQRVGANGRLFTMWKFRTMWSETDAGPAWTTADDPRRTRIGAVLRRLSIDELPQLWNVLRGDMSIVGPRPEQPLFVARFDRDHIWYRYRHRIRPGITGLSQVRGLRGDTPVEDRLRTDNWYIEHWSLTLDLWIAARTLAAVLHGRNAY